MEFGLSSPHFGTRSAPSKTFADPIRMLAETGKDRSGPKVWGDGPPSFRAYSV